MASHDWGKIQGEYLKGKDIKWLSKHYGFNLKHWYRKYHQQWRIMKEEVEEEIRRQLIEEAIKEEKARRSTIRETYDKSFEILRNKILLTMNNKDMSAKEKFEEQKFNKITAEGLAICKGQQFEINHMNNAKLGGEDEEEEQVIEVVGVDGNKVQA